MHIKGIILALGIFSQLFAQNLFVPGKVFLKVDAHDSSFSSSLSPADFAQFSVLEVEKPFKTADARLQDIYELKLVPGQEVAFCEWAENLSWVTYAEPVPYVYAHYTPDDFDSVRLSHLPIIRATEAWDLERGDESVVIAIIDNGLLTSHTDLQANLWINPLEIAGDSIDNDGNGFIDDIYGYDVADDDADPSIPNRAYRHGSHVAGCAAAVTDNGNGIASIGFGCSLMAVKIASDQGPSNTYTFDQALKGVDYAIRNGADIINMSFGGTFYSLTGQIMMEVGHDRGIIFVAAAGNGPGDTNPATGDTTWEYPASFEHVISVSTTDVADKRAGIATVNSAVDVCAPGLQIRSTVPSISLGSSYANLSGTSMSCGIVSGLLGLMLSHNPCLSPDQAEALLKMSCVDLDALNPAWAGKLGSGRIDAYEALGLIETLMAPKAAVDKIDSIVCDSLLVLAYLPDTLAACPDTWHWSLSNGETDSTVRPSFKLDSSGWYTITLQVSNAWGADTLSLQQYVSLAPLPELDAGHPIYISKGDTAQLMATGNGQDYFWKPTTGLWPSAEIADPKAAPDTTTRYWVWATSAVGCSNSDSVTIFVDPTSGVNFGNEQDENPFHVNWFSLENKLRIKSNRPLRGNLTVSLYNMEGKNIKSSQKIFFNESAGFYISFNQPLTQGMYFIVFDYDGNRWSRKCLIN